MKKKLNCILLIDDDLPTNFINERVIRKMCCSEYIKAVQGGFEALDYLKSSDIENNPPPDLIFLDINMPGMNGWEFLEEYVKLETHQKSKAVIVMLTTSLNPDEKDKADKISQISGFLNKPLYAEGVKTILQENFPEYI